ncbi:MAG TPA: TIGR04222 domain-containing membrane protein [Candidatus Saccharimonadales bacterium]|jgi:uncharacterized protein (TIGR04222 family)|nr:TIGR04222 domain-containing membrane protein [Candidatus Saccharimonadales bacterium]
MNPFDLRGPEFLLFYTVLVVVTLLALRWVRQSHESGPMPPISLQDPYLLACLGGGSEGVIRVCLVSLMDRGLLELSADRKVIKGPHWDVKSGQNEMETELLRHVRFPRELQEIFKEALILNVAVKYEEPLRASRLLPAVEDQAFRRRLITYSVLLLLGVSFVKILVAVARGYTNIGFLMLVSLIAVFGVVKEAKPRRTRLGDDFLKSVRSVFGDLRGRASSVKPGGSTKELMWLTALFGLSVLPQSAFPFVKYFRPASASISGSTCGSGCSSSSGGSCGGGGCGGGCGGCGG